MRPAAGILLALMVVLAGCGTGLQGSTATPTPETPTSADGTATPADGTATPADGGDGTDGEVVPPDPATDRLGWESGYWYNESLAITPDDGLNESERRMVVARAMARVEHIRELEFDEQVPVEIISRDQYRERTTNRSTYTQGFRRFDNAKFEAMFLVGEDRDSIAVQEANRGTAVLGFYSVRNDTIVVVSESDTPKIRDELTLGHELLHALQDQHFNLSSYHAATRDEFNGQRGLVEGDANFVEERYSQRCASGEWECISLPGEDGGAGGDLHLGTYFLSFFPYSDGPSFVDYHFERGGWEAVNAVYADPPTTAEQVIYPEKYPDERAVDVTIEDTNRSGWERIRPEPAEPNGTRADYARLGQSAVTTMFVYTIFDDYNRSQLVTRADFVNFNSSGGIDSSDPFNYAIAESDGWDGDRMHVYQHPEHGNETAYVWKLVWASPAEAEEFARGYRELLAHWGGTRVSENVWRVENSPFADAFYLDVTGDTVVVVNAPTEEALGDVYAGAR